LKSERFFFSFSKNFPKDQGKKTYFSTPFKHLKIGFWWIFLSQSFPLEIALKQDSKSQSRSEEILSNLELFFCEKNSWKKNFELKSNRRFLKICSGWKKLLNIRRRRIKIEIMKKFYQFIIILKKWVNIKYNIQGTFLFMRYYIQLWLVELYNNNMLLIMAQYVW